MSSLTFSPNVPHRGNCVLKLIEIPYIICILPSIPIDNTTNSDVCSSTDSDVIKDNVVVGDDDEWREDGDNEEVNSQADVEEVVKAGPTDELPEDGRVEDSGDKSNDKYYNKTSCQVQALHTSICLFQPRAFKFGRVVSLINLTSSVGINLITSLINQTMVVREAIKTVDYCNLVIICMTKNATRRDTSFASF